MAYLAPICEHPSSKPLLDAAATAADGQPVTNPIRLADAAAVWATDIESLTRTEPGSYIPEHRSKHSTSLAVLTQALHGVEEAAHAQAVSQADAHAQAELRVRLVRMQLAAHPLLDCYLKLLKRMHATGQRVDPTRD
jgi:hypothetical protein